jgi:hypothetical protein
MLLLYFSRMSMPQAEEKLATLWRAAEEYGLESPRVNFRFLPGALVNLEVLLDQPHSTAVINCLQRHNTAPGFAIRPPTFVSTPPCGEAKAKNSPPLFGS